MAVLFASACGPAPLQLELVLPDAPSAAAVERISVTAVEARVFDQQRGGERTVSCAEIGRLRASHAFAIDQTSGEGSFVSEPIISGMSFDPTEGGFDLALADASVRGDREIAFVFEAFGPARYRDQVRDAPLLEGCTCVTLDRSALDVTEDGCIPIAMAGAQPLRVPLEPLITPDFELTTCGFDRVAAPAAQRTELSPGFCLEPVPCADDGRACFECRTNNCREKEAVEGAALSLAGIDGPDAVRPWILGPAVRASVRPPLVFDDCDEEGSRSVEAWVFSAYDRRNTVQAPCVPSVSFGAGYARTASQMLPADRRLVGLSVLPNPLGPPALIASSDSDASSWIEAFVIEEEQMRRVAAVELPMERGLGVHGYLYEPARGRTPVLAVASFEPDTPAEIRLRHLRLNGNAFEVLGDTLTDGSQCACADGCDLNQCQLREVAARGSGQVSSRVVMRSGDIDGDGYADLALASHRETLVGVFSAQPSADRRNGETLLALAPATGDCRCVGFAGGIEDLALTPRVISTGPERLDLVVASQTGLWRRQWDERLGDHVRMSGASLLGYSRLEAIDDWLILVGESIDQAPRLLEPETLYSSPRHELELEPINGEEQSNPIGLARGDFNGDGVADLAISLADPPEVRIFVGAPQARPSELTADLDGYPKRLRLSPAGGCRIQGDMVAADFDGDGRSELVVACASQTRVGLYWAASAPH